MITYVQGDLFTSAAQTLVNTVNTVGVMGKGIAKEFKAIYPEMFKEYQRRCERGEFTTGQIMLYRTPHKIILNFPTKRHWRSPSQVSFIEAGLQAFQQSYAAFGISSVAFPQLGCGNGELRWEEDVRPLMEEYLGGLPIDVFIHIYDTDANTPEHRVPAETRRWLRSEPRALAFSEVWDDIGEVLNQDELLSRVWMIEPAGENAQLVWHDGDDVIVLPRDDLLDLWQRLRVTGYLAPADMPQVAHPMMRQLFDLLARLGYIDPIRMAVVSSVRESRDVATGRLFDDTDSWGLKLMTPVEEPRAPALQPNLFSMSQP